jgi:hypothetical protein
MQVNVDIVAHPHGSPRRDLPISDLCRHLEQRALRRCSNTSAKESCWPSFFMRPDGVVTGKLRRNVPGVLISDVDPRKKYYDSTVLWRERAMRGVFHSGKLLRDPRSKARTRL